MSQSLFANAISPSDVPTYLKKWVLVGTPNFVLDSVTGACAAGTVVGFGKKYVPRGGIDHKRAGVYIDFQHATVTLPDGREVCAGLTPDFFGSPEVKELSRAMSRIWVKLHDLPDTPFWEGDIVVFTHDQNRGIGARGHWVVEYVTYSQNRIGTHLVSCEDGRKTAGFDQSNLSLIKRGNLWKMEHGEPMEFASIEEEALFYKSLGMSQKVMDRMHPEVPLNEGVRMLRDGKADQMKLKNKKDLTYVLDQVRQRRIW